MQQCCEASHIQVRMVVPLLPVSYGLICNDHCGRSIIEHKTVSICDIIFSYEEASNHMKRSVTSKPCCNNTRSALQTCIISCQMIMMSTVRVSCFQCISICTIDKKHDNAINKWSAQWSISREDDESQKLMFLHLFTELFWEDFSSVSTQQNKSRCNIQQSICHIYNIHLEEIYFESVSENPFLNQS